MRPLLIVGDIQGDVERLEEALAGYPEDEVDTIFLGDFFQGGQLGHAGGARAASVARSRRNSRTVLGNHDVFVLVMLERRRGVSGTEEWRTLDGGSLEDFWLARRGDWADLDALDADPALEEWLRSRPLMLLLDDGTLVQHTDDDSYAAIGGSVAEVNATARSWLAEPGQSLRVVRHLIGRRAFDDAARLDRYLARWGARRLVHGHTPHWHHGPEVRHEGKVWGFDGRFSRFWGREPHQGAGPIEATVALLPRLDG